MGTVHVTTYSDKSFGQFVEKEEVAKEKAEVTG
jgi:hypothetical protein